MNKWQLQDKQLLEIQRTLIIPSFDLRDVPYVRIQSAADLEDVPKTGGDYFIWTTSPVSHSLNGAGCASFGGGKVIYNGLAKNDLRGRCATHLVRDRDQVGGMSAISVQIYTGDQDNRSHTKTAYAPPKANGKPSRKVPKIDGKQVSNIRDLLRLQTLSESDRSFLMVADPSKPIWFQNGVDVRTKPHSEFEWRFYFISGLKSDLYVDHIEREWRVQNGSPQLCTYSSGR